MVGVSPPVGISPDVPWCATCGHPVGSHYDLKCYWPGCECYGETEERRGAPATEALPVQEGS